MIALPIFPIEKILPYFFGSTKLFQYLFCHKSNSNSVRLYAVIAFESK